MRIVPHRAAAALFTGLLLVSLPAHAVSCLLFPLSCLKPSKKFGEEMEAQVLDIRMRKTEHYEIGSDAIVRMGWTSLENKEDWYVWFKVGNTLYQGWHQNTGLVSTWVSYKPRRAEWIGKTFKMRFYDEKFLGIAGVGAIFKRPDGDDWRLTIVSIMGPDGVEECKFSAQVCPPQSKIDRAAREAEQLAKVQKSGGKSATDVAPAPVDIPEAPPAAAAAATPEAAPAAGAAPATPAAEPAPAPAPAASPGSEAASPTAAPHDEVSPAAPAPPSGASPK